MALGGFSGVTIITMIGLIRIMTLTCERVALNRLGQAGKGALATMGVGFGGAAVVLWMMSILYGEDVLLDSTLWTGALYAVGFGFYTASFARGPIGLVSPWSNATVVLLWLYHPMTDFTAWIGLIIFGIGALILTHRQMTYPVIWMLISSVLLASARIVDIHHVASSPIAYATGVFTAISLWMLVPIIATGNVKSLIHLTVREPGWSFIASTSNAGAYLSLFILLQWLHPATVEALSAFASSLTTFVGVFWFHETHAKRKIISSLFVTTGTILLLFS